MSDRKHDPRLVLLTFFCFFFLRVLTVHHENVYFANEGELRSQGCVSYLNIGAFHCRGALNISTNKACYRELVGPQVKIKVSSFYWPPNNPVWRFEPLIEIATSWSQKASHVALIYLSLSYTRNFSSLWTSWVNMFASLGKLAMLVDQVLDDIHGL